MTSSDDVIYFDKIFYRFLPKQIDFIYVLLYYYRHRRTRSHCTGKKNKKSWNLYLAVLSCSSHAMTSPVIYYSTDTRNNELHVSNNVNNNSK